VTFDLSTVASSVFPANTTKTIAYLRAAFYVGLTQTSVDSYYANDLVYKGKPIYVEFSMKINDTDSAAAQLVKNAKEILRMGEAPILNVEQGTESGHTSEVTFTATNGYQIIREAAIQEYDDSIYAIDCCSSEGGFVNVVTGVTPFLKDTKYLFDVSSDGKSLVENTLNPNTDFAKKANGTGSLASDEVWIYPGAEAFGDYNWIMHNLRLPTSANTNYWSPNGYYGENELPVANGQYIQYTIRIQNAVDNVGVGVVGQRAMSVTTHVLYVLNTNDVKKASGATDYLEDLLG